MLFARHTFELLQPQKDGETLLVHLNAVWEKSGEQPKELAEGPELPASCTQLWAYFTELHHERGSNGFGASRITRRDIREWEADTGVQLESWEKDAIRQSDNLWLSEFAPKPKEGEA